VPPGRIAVLESSPETKLRVSQPDTADVSLRGELRCLPKPELAYFAIADISGYTSFLAEVELDHA
jgi:hypothetical protein